MRRLLWLFKTHLWISAFTFGGGYVVIPMIRKYFLEQKNILTEEEITDMAAIAQSSPGAIAINLAALSGFRVEGLRGALVSCVAAVLPPFFILSIVSGCYAAFSQNLMIAAILRGMEAGVAALIVSLVLDMYRAVIKESNRFLTLMVPCVFAASFFLKINVIGIIMTCCLLCVADGIRKRKREKI